MSETADLDWCMVNGVVVGCQGYHGMQGHHDTFTLKLSLFCAAALYWGICLLPSLGGNCWVEVQSGGGGCLA